jgi:hypothetical protein
MIYFHTDIENNMIVAKYNSQVVEFTDTNENREFYDSLKRYGAQPDKHTRSVQYTEEIWQECLDLSADMTPKWLDATGHLISFDDAFMFKRDDIGCVIFIARSWHDGQLGTLLIEGHSSETTDRILVCCISGERTEGLYRLAASNLDMIKHLGDDPGSFFYYKKADESA